MPYKSVLYKKWPRNPSCPPKCPAKTPCQNALQKWPRNLSCPLNALLKRLIKVAPKPKLPSKCLAKTTYKSGPET